MILSLYFKLFIQFFKTGLLSFGGGYATLPFLYEIAEKHDWYNVAQLKNMIALSSITPGPVGINMATFAGFSISGILGALVGTIAIILPSLIIVTGVSKIIDKFKSNIYVNSVIRTLKPVGCALLSAVLIKLLFTSNLQLIGVLFLTAFIISACIKKKDPLFYLGTAAIVGLACGYLNIIGV